MKGCLVFCFGILCAVAYFKWDAVRERLPDFRDVRSFVPSIKRSPEKQEDSGKARLTDEDRFLLMTEWRNSGGARCRAQYSRMKELLDSHSVFGYAFDERDRRAVEKALGEFSVAIRDNDYLNAGRRGDRADEALRKFLSGCKWQPGMRDGSGLQAGAVPGSVVLEPGYEMHGGRPMRVITCKRCNGRGHLEERYRCSQCQGSGQVRNPAAGLKRVARTQARSPLERALFDAAAETIAPDFTQCGNCQGRGVVFNYPACPDCSGQGKIWR